MSAHDQWSLAHARMPACRKDVEFVIAHDSMLRVNTLLLSSSHTTALILFSHCSRFRLLLLFHKARKFFVRSFCILDPFPALARLS
jgi:hypothetical protein